MSPVYCHECGRANSAVVKKCIWCGVSLADETSGKLDTTRVEIGYLEGIDRFEDAAPVRLTINDEGIEVVELMPGSRSVKIPASSILDTSVADASTLIEGESVRQAWWLRALERVGLAFRGRKTPDTKKHDYVLTIKYKAADEVRNAVFHREDSVGLAVVEGLARIVSALARKK